jgi:uncharacterized membrane protein
MSPQIPQIIEEFKKKHSIVRNANIEHQQNLSRMDKLALWITEHVGSMGFFFIIFIWTVVWMGWNTLAPAATRFDPYPAFVLWLFISNVIQIFLMPLIMIGQNLQSAHAEVRAEVDFEINKKAEQEIETILLHLEEQDKMILQILQRLEANQKTEG